MATVNLLSNSWSSSTTTSNINVTVDVDTSRFACSTSVAGYAKIYIPISDISKYNSITFKYNKFAYTGSYSWVVGVFDDADASTRVGDVVTDGFSTSGGTITFDVSSLSGTKYVGFRFAAYAGASSSNPSYASMWMTSLTAVERGYTLTYNANGGSGAPSSVSNITSTTISSTVPTKDGHNFLGWSTSSSATYASYVAGDSISLISDTTLYAVWQKVTYTITYNANGGSNAPSYQEKLHGVDLVLTESKPTPPSREDAIYTINFNANGGFCDTDFVDVNDYTEYYFEGWNTDAGGTGDTYYSGGKYSQDSSVTLYAQYSSYSYDAVTRLPTPTRENHDFLGWATDPYATSGTTGNYNPTDNVTLYAVWKCRGNVYLNDGSGFNPYQVLINDGSGWNQYIPYIYTESGWEVYSG